MQQDRCGIAGGQSQPPSWQPTQLLHSTVVAPDTMPALTEHAQGTGWRCYMAMRGPDGGLRCLYSPDTVYVHVEGRLHPAGLAARQSQGEMIAYPTQSVYPFSMQTAMCTRWQEAIKATMCFRLEGMSAELHALPGPCQRWSLKWCFEHSSKTRQMPVCKRHNHETWRARQPSLLPGDAQI